LVALAIFLLSLAAITRLVTFAGQRALDARRTDEACRLARSKLAEVFAGVVPLQGSDDQPFEEEPDYTWSLTADSASMTGLWTVTVTVKRKGDEGPGFTLQQFMLDPTIRGSTQDTVTVVGAANASSSSGGSSGSSGSSGSGGSSSGAKNPAEMAGAGAMPAASKSSAPAGGGSSGGKAPASNTPSSGGRSGSSSGNSPSSPSSPSNSSSSKR
jgi:hypothetical protein